MSSAKVKKVVAEHAVVHGAATLNHLSVDSYNLEIRDKDGFLGDRASKKALNDLIAKWCSLLGDSAEHFATTAAKPGRRAIGKAFLGEDLEALGVAESIVEDFAQTLFAIIARFLKAPAWRGTERIVIGGGARATRLGTMAIARAGMLLRQAKIKVELRLIANDPDDAGLLGACYLAPAWMFKGFDGLLAIDIGGTNIRAGIVSVKTSETGVLTATKVRLRAKWRHKDDKPSRTGTMDELAKMLTRLIKAAKRDGVQLAPFIGIGCPGLISPEGVIKRGAQNLPGDWSGKHFHLAAEICNRIPMIADVRPTVVIHNDAVVQGLSEIPRMADVKHWAVLTLGTGLGNARFTNTA